MFLIAIYFRILSFAPGLVYNYDEGGTHVDSSLKWSMCLAVNILDTLKGCSSMILKNWDERLYEYSNKSEWTYDKYVLDLIVAVGKYFC